MNNHTENMVNRKILNIFGLTLEQYTKLDRDVQRMLVQEYWRTRNQKEKPITKVLTFLKKR